MEDLEPPLREEEAYDFIENIWELFLTLSYQYWEPPNTPLNSGVKIL